MRTGPFIISRTFHAPLDLTWQAWSDRDCLVHWFGPKGFEMPLAHMDFRPGGTFHYCLRSPDGRQLWGKFVYREIVASERMVLVNSFSDERGGVTRHPTCPTWPLEMLSRFTFKEREGKTMVTVQWSPLNATEAEQNTFQAGYEDVKRGWDGTFRQLAAHLARLSPTRNQLLQQTPTKQEKS